MKSFAKENLVFSKLTNASVPVKFGEKDCIEFNCDLNKVNYSQRNNKLVWKRGDLVTSSNTMCNVTSVVMALDYAGWKLPGGDFEQPEDNLGKFISENDEIDERYKKDYPALYKEYQEGIKTAYTPNEIHSLLCLGANLWLGVENGQAVKFETGLDFRTVLSQQVVGKTLPLVISMRCPYKGRSGDTYLNHIACLTGVGYAVEDLQKLNSELIGEDLASREAEAFDKLKELTPVFVKIDDPYGNTTNNFVGSGNDTRLDWDYVEKNFKDLNSKTRKWCHIINKPVSII